MVIGSLRKNHTYRQRNMVVLLKKQERGGSDMKIYVMLKYRPLGNEVYIGIKKNRKEAEKCLRQLFPHMRIMNDTLNT